MRNLIIKLVTQSKRATAGQLAQVTAQAGLAPFAADLLEVDEALWGGFWQGDVIAPGYRLPAVELALLRAVRLDSTWPEGTTVAEFLADLRTAILDPQAGIWAVMAAGAPCVVFASVGEQEGEGEGGRSAVGGPTGRLRTQRSVTVVWYCATTGRLHAGYRTAVDRLKFEGAVEQRSFKDPKTVQPASEQNSPLLGLDQSSYRPEQSGDEGTSSSGQRSHGEASHSVVGGQDLAARLDAALLRFRRQGS